MWLFCALWLTLFVWGAFGFNSTKESLLYPYDYAWLNRTHYYQDGNDSQIKSNTVDACTSFYLSPLFTDDMILQREPSQAVIFGFGTPNGSVEVTLIESNNPSNTQTFTATITDGASKDSSLGLGECSWHVILPAMPATLGNGSRYDFTFECVDNCKNWTSNETIKISNVQFGDVWACTGQSNMMLGVDHTFSWYNYTINQTTMNYNIQVIKIKNVQSLVPLDSRSYFGNDLQWQQASYTNLTNLEFSAVCYYYARHIVDFWRANNLGMSTFFFFLLVQGCL